MKNTLDFLNNNKYTLLFIVALLLVNDLGRDFANELAKNELQSLDAVPHDAILNILGIMLTIYGGIVTVVLAFGAVYTVLLNKDIIKKKVNENTEAIEKRIHEKLSKDIEIVYRENEKLKNGLVEQIEETYEKLDKKFEMLKATQKEDLAFLEAGTHRAMAYSAEFPMTEFLLKIRSAESYAKAAKKIYPTYNVKMMLAQAKRTLDTMDKDDFGSVETDILVEIKTIVDELEAKYDFEIEELKRHKNYKRLTKFIEGKSGTTPKD